MFTLSLVESEALPGWNNDIVRRQATRADVEAWLAYLDVAEQADVAWQRCQAVWVKPDKSDV